MTTQQRELLILGGPGCGKTTALLKIVDKCFENGIPPERIAYLAFTRKAANEARDRAVVRYGIEKSRFPMFRTLHSFCFMQMALTRNEIMQDSDYTQVGGMLNLRFSHMVQDWGLHMGTEKGDRIAYIDQLSRLLQRDCRQVMQQLGEQELRYWDVKLYTDTLERYKKSRGLYDFTDILEQFLEHGHCPMIDVLIVDEAQDLSPLQWRVIEKLKQNCARVYYAGDDDQAIYRWAGADVDYFLSLKADRHVLPVSHRLPRNIFDIANNITKRITRRYAKDWRPAREGGEIHKYAHLEYADMSSGSWLILARNRYMLSNARAHLYSKGLPFYYEGMSSVDNESARAVHVYEQLRKGKSVMGAELKQLYKKLKPVVVPHSVRAGDVLVSDHLYSPQQLVQMQGLNLTHAWQDALRLTSADISYFGTVLSKNESLQLPPRISVNTIHAVKGGEADNVVLMPDMSASSYRDFMRTPDNEARVFYVAVSRAKQALHLIHPQSTKFFPI